MPRPVNWAGREGQSGPKTNPPGPPRSASQPRPALPRPRRQYSVVRNVPRVRRSGRGRDTRHGAASTPKYQRDTLGAATVSRHYFPSRAYVLAGEGARRALPRPEGSVSHGPGRAGLGAAGSGGNCSSLPGKLILVEPCHVVSGPAGVREPPRRRLPGPHYRTHHAASMPQLLSLRLIDWC